MHDPDREVWKDIPKAALLQYYHSIHKLILPHLRNRPQSLHVKPINAMAPGFYIKDMEERTPDCGDIFRDKRKHPKKGKRNIIDYLVCNNEATLLYMINLGCIDINPWNSTTRSPGKPDYVVIDLDPSDNDFEKAIETALAAQEIFKQHRLQAYIKTSGKTGLHIYLPCKGIDYPQARKIAEHLCDQIHESVRDITTTNINVSQRGNKLYIDPNQNDYSDTVAAPYSVRPYQIPSVSTPLQWKEIKRGLDPYRFRLETISKRLEKKGELWEDLHDPVKSASNLKGFKYFF